ncbi:hypothetical protein JR316_0008947 [Psilocybe cubensis]|uniref:Uncharacterized protein n=2 Tax=Psilocybe cubensis TaxID=181762 RepID=A0A8H7XUG8_PSICU|nr:hypothetical protein JR316_0008947 [Psilocybe cubensis]KAH9478492.1 hypothetical protein JR316_0008947 [Psilocybe cubensis]
MTTSSRQIEIFIEQKMAYRNLKMAQIAKLQRFTTSFRDGVMQAELEEDIRAEYLHELHVMELNLKRLHDALDGAFNAFFAESIDAAALARLENNLLLIERQFEVCAAIILEYLQASLIYSLEKLTSLDYHAIGNELRSLAVLRSMDLPLPEK